MGNGKAAGIVAYLRVSTKRQGQSGLGLEAQREAIRLYAEGAGLPVLAEYKEVESGRRNERPELARALGHARRAGATLVVGRLDRLSRCASFLLTLLDAGVEVVACDCAHVNRLTLSILACVAEDEASRISSRTKAALAAYKARGGKLGGALAQCRNLDDAARAKGQRAAAKAIRARAVSAYADLGPQLVTWRNAGNTLAWIAAHLNAQGQRTRQGGKWHPVQVARVLARFQVPVGRRGE